MTSRPHRLKKTSSMQSKRRDLHHAWLHRETNEKLSFYRYSPRWITTTFSTTLLYLPQLVRMARKLNMLRIGRSKPGTSKKEGLCYAKSRFLCLSSGGGGVSPGLLVRRVLELLFFMVKSLPICTDMLWTLTYLQVVRGIITRVSGRVDRASLSLHVSADIFRKNYFATVCI